MRTKWIGRKDPYKEHMDWLSRELQRKDGYANYLRAHLKHLERYNDEDAYWEAREVEAKLIQVQKEIDRLTDEMGALMDM